MYKYITKAHFEHQHFVHYNNSTSSALEFERLKEGSSIVLKKIKDDRGSWSRWRQGIKHV